MSSSLKPFASDASLSGRVDGYRRLPVCRRGKNSQELDCDERKEHEQVNAQRPKSDSDRGGNLDPWHISGSSSGASDKSFHDIAIMNDPDKVVVLIHDRDHMKLIPGEQFGQIFSPVVALGGNDR